jgi:hypothetical protein
MNGISIPQFSMPNPVVQLIEQILADAKAGHITSIAFVASSGGGFGYNYVGPQRGDLHTGACALARKLLNDIETPEKKSPIVRAAMNG